MKHVWSPIIDYNCSVWGKYKKKCGKNIQLRAQRYFLGVHNKALIDGISGDFGWMPTKYRRYITMCQLWNQLVKLEDHRLPRKLLNFEIENVSNTKSWFQMLRAVLPVLNISDINTSFLFDIGHSRCILLQKSEVEWKEALKNKPKLRSYRHFKQRFDTQNYVNLNMSKYQRSLTARL